jgi:hypothetical protein
VADDAADSGQPERLALPIKMDGETSALQLDGSSHWIHPRSSHCGQVDDEPAVTDRVASHGVPAAPHRRRQVVLPAEAHGGHDIGSASASSNQCRPPLHVSVPDLPGGVIARPLRLDQLAAEVRGQRLDDRSVDRYHLAPRVLAWIVRPAASEEKCND